MAFPGSNLITVLCIRNSFITVYLYLMTCLCGDKAHFWRMKSENYDWQVYEGKSVQINQIGIGGFLLNYQYYQFCFCFSCYWLCLQGLSVLDSNRFLGLPIKVWVATTADAPLKWPCIYSRSKPVCVFFWCYNVTWHVMILCNLGAVVLSLELKRILLGGKKKALNLAPHWCHANSKGFCGFKYTLKE